MDCLDAHERLAAGEGVALLDREAYDLTVVVIRAPFAQSIEERLRQVVDVTAPVDVDGTP